jgi:hypothetical protein
VQGAIMVWLKDASFELGLNELGCANRLDLLQKQQSNIKLKLTDKYHEQQLSLVLLLNSKPH